MQDNDDNEYPEKRPLDSALELAKDVAGSLFPGTPAITALIKTAHSRRLEEFHRRTAQRLDALEQSNVTTLLDRAIGGDHEAKEEVLSTYATISRLVSEAMDEDKRMALAAAMASSLQWPAEEGAAAERRLFVRCLTEFETIHVVLISRAKSGVQAIKDLYNASGILGETAKTAWQDLNARGMVNIDSPNVVMTNSGMNADRTTLRGQRFLQFIDQAD